MFALTATSAVALLAASSAHAQFGGSGTPAQETVTIGVTVDNVLDLTVDQNIEFGTVAAYADVDATDDLIIDTGGTISTTQNTDGFVYVVDNSAAQAGQITIVGAAPNSTLNVHPVTTTAPTDGTSTFTVTDYTTELVGGGTNADITSGTNVTHTADADFATDEVIRIGVHLTTPTSGADRLLSDGVYAGAFTIDIGY